MIVGSSDEARPFKLHELRCFEAVVRLGSFQAAARALNRTHPSVFAAVLGLEEQVGLVLLDRSAYRVSATEAGSLFFTRALASLRELDSLGRYAQHLSRGDEPILRVVLGDLCPYSLVLPMLSSFFGGRDLTRLHLDYEAVGGPAERLRCGTADLVFHRGNETDTSIEQIKLRDVHLIPVVAPGFLPLGASKPISRDHLQSFTQCVIRDTARESEPEQHFIIDGSHQCSVADHAMKKAMILRRVGWGHLPDFMIQEELQAGTLVSIRGPSIPGRTESLAAIRRTDRAHGPVATALWQELESAFAG